ncbi:hypothetical protein IWW38_002743, partial [Coemansia aciculifera]
RTRWQDSAQWAELSAMPRAGPSRRWWPAQASAQCISTRASGSRTTRTMDTSWHSLHRPCCCLPWVQRHCGLVLRFPRPCRYWELARQRTMPRRHTRAATAC